MQIILMQAELTYMVFREEVLLSFGFGYPVYWLLQPDIRTRETFQEFMIRQLERIVDLYELQEGEIDTEETEE